MYWTEKIRNQESEKFQSKLQRLEEDRKSKALRLKQLEDKAFSVEEREQQTQGARGTH